MVTNTEPDASTQMNTNQYHATILRQNASMMNTLAGLVETMNFVVPTPALAIPPSVPDVPYDVPHTLLPSIPQVNGIGTS